MSDIPPEIIIQLPVKSPLPTLPFELIENILSRLPVKTLKRFRAVAKPWCYLIDSEKFAKLHLHRSLISNSHRYLITGLLGFYSIGLDSLDRAHGIKPPFEFDYKNVHAISNSINGMVVVMREPEPPILWNPFSREYKVLPKCPLDFPAGSDLSCKTTYGFGYDSRNDDYKVVKVMEFKKPSSWMYSEEWIYGLKSNCWRRTEGTYYDRGHWPVHVNGALHTLIRTDPDHMSMMKIMAFSVESEKDYEVMMPQGIDMIMKDIICLSLDVFDGYLALVCSYPCEVGIWVMEEYGVKESWNALLSYQIEQGGFVRPLVYSKERDKILLNCSGKSLACWDLRRMSVEDFVMPFVMSPGLCVETLISPNGWEKRNTGERSCGSLVSPYSPTGMMTDKQEEDGQGKKGNEVKKKREDFLSVGFKLKL